MIEGALAIYPKWEEMVDVKRVGFDKPRKEVVELLGEENQWLPVLVLEEKQTITDPVEIINYLADTYGGPAIHP